jgi:hypothetical protein
MPMTQDFRTLPPRPHLEYLRNEAKRRHTALKTLSRDAHLSDAQLLVARDYGFPAWPALKAEVDRRRLCGAAQAMPPPAFFRQPAWGRPSGRFGVLKSPDAMEQAFFPAAAMGMATLQLGGMLGMLLLSLLT